MSKTIVGTILCILLMIGNVNAISQPQGLFGLKWGMSLDECNEIMEVIVSKGQYTSVQSIGELVVTVNISFYDNKLYEIKLLDFPAGSLNKFNNALIEKYGVGEKYQNSYALMYSWYFTDVVIRFSLTWDRGIEPYITYTYMPLFNLKVKKVKKFQDFL